MSEQLTLPDHTHTHTHTRMLVLRAVSSAAVKLFSGLVSCFRVCVDDCSLSLLSDGELKISVCVCVCDLTEEGELMRCVLV